MNKKQKKIRNRIILAGIIFAVFFVLEHTGFWEQMDHEFLLFFLHFVLYLLIGYDVVWKALRNIRRGQIFDENFLMMIATFGAFGVQDYMEAVAVMLFYQIGELFQS